MARNPRGKLAEPDAMCQPLLRSLCVADRIFPVSLSPRGGPDCCLFFLWTFLGSSLAGVGSTSTGCYVIIKLRENKMKSTDLSSQRASQ